MLFTVVASAALVAALATVGWLVDVPEEDLEAIWPLDE
jgi:hypothetical protein